MITIDRLTIVGEKERWDKNYMMIAIFGLLNLFPGHRPEVWWELPHGVRGTYILSTGMWDVTGIGLSYSQRDQIKKRIQEELLRVDHSHYVELCKYACACHYFDEHKDYYKRAETAIQKSRELYIGAPGKEPKSIIVITPEKDTEQERRNSFVKLASILKGL